MRVLADGCFDPLHIGHIRYLAEAAKLGRPLIVNVAPDTAIEAKGRQPFQNRNERAMMVLSIGVVDRVVMHDCLADAILSEVPQYLVKGPEWRGALPADVQQACREAETDVFYTQTRTKGSTERLHDARSV